MFAQSVYLLHDNRRGVTSLSLLIGLPVLLLLVGLVVYVGLLRDARQDAQAGADAAALAGARLLADDSLLLLSNYRERMEQRVLQSRQMALMVGQLNFSGNERLQLNANQANDPRGDIVIGYLDRPLHATFTPLTPDTDSWDNSAINAVRVVVRRSPIPALLGGRSPEQDVVATATAILDWRVIGYRPRNEQPVPLMPIALYTDHDGVDPQGWDGQWLRRDKDSWSYDPSGRRWQVGRDGLPEIVVRFGNADNNTSRGAALFLQIGVEDFGGTLTQIRQGIRRTELERQFGAGGFVLRSDNKVQVTAQAGLPPATSPARMQLLEALQELAGKGESRIWPLYSRYDAEQGQAAVSGWTAARIAAVVADEDSLELELQPCVLPHCAALTQNVEPRPAFWQHNRMVCRVRLAE